MLRIAASISGGVLALASVGTRAAFGPHRQAQFDAWWGVCLQDDLVRSSLTYLNRSPSLLAPLFEATLQHPCSRSRLCLPCSPRSKSQSEQFRILGAAQDMPLPPRQVPRSPFGDVPYAFQPAAPHLFHARPRHSASTMPPEVPL